MVNTNARLPDRPFDQAAWVAASLAIMRGRLQIAVDRQGAGTPWPEELLEAERDLAALANAAAEAGVFLPIRWLGSRLALTDTEQRVLWVLIAHELCPTSRSLLRALNTETLADPSTEAIRQAVYSPAPLNNGWRELAAAGRLRRLGLIERTDADALAPEHRQTWRVASRVVALANGDTGLDPELSTVTLEPTEGPCGIGGQGLEVAAESEAAISAAVDSAKAKGHGFVIVQAQDGAGRRALLVAAATARGLRVVSIDASAIAKEPERARRQLRVLARECELLDLVPLIRNVDVLAGAQDIPDRIELLEQQLGDRIVLATTRRALARRWLRPPRTIELARLTGAQLTRLWARALPMVIAEDAATLANMYPLTPALIDAAARIAVENAGTASLTPDHLTAGLRAVLDDRLAGLATRVNVSQSWDDLVLLPEQASSLMELLARVRERRLVYEDWGFARKVGRGLGVSALFSGPPGTGKTMAAGLVARDLGTELYQVDLSKIVSKWIGETERNLAALFDAAEAGHAILLFDEADTLFGKRTDVKSSNDRNANQETNYLLQRLESFSGVCILTTNHDAAIDEAFRRRLSIHVQFPMPDIEERANLWRALIPTGAPLDHTPDFDALARQYEMSGGYIRNAVLRAAFLAADLRVPMGAEHFARAAQLEYQSMGRVIASAP